jgi:cell division protein ZapA (FtsZ GTPase activity inhibitor)
VEPAAKQAVRVTILSRPYTLRTSGDPAEVEALAASIDALMLNIASKAPNADSTHIAVLACLHLADSLREAERELGALKDRIGEKSQRFAGLLDQLISSAGETL